MSKLTYVVNNTSKQTVVFGSISIPSVTYNFPMTVEEDGADDVLINQNITAGLLFLVSVTPVSLPSQNTGFLTKSEAASVKALALGSSGLSPFIQLGPQALTAQQFLIANAVATSFWASSKVVGLTAIATAMLSLGQASLQLIPARVTPYRITGVTRYLDPTWGGPFNGTLSQPYNSPAQATLTAGDGLLFKAGTTCYPTVEIRSSSVSGTSIAPIIYGVYDPDTGLRVHSRLGTVIINCANTVDTAFNLYGLTYICVDGFKIINKKLKGSSGAIILGGSSSNCQVLNCEIPDTNGSGISCSSGVGHVIEGNLITNPASNGIDVYDAVNDLTTTIQFNTVRGVKGPGIARGIICFSDSGTKFKGLVACNLVEDVAITSGAPYGIAIVGQGGSGKVFRNTVRRALVGIFVDGYIGISSDWSGFLLENNDCNNNEFGVQMINMYGTWLAQYNRCVGNGSLDGINPVSSSRYGRGFEIWAENGARPTADGTVRFNYVAGSYNFETNATEGVGIGVDDNCRNIQVYGNYLYANEGNGLQVHNSTGTSMFGNILVNNNCAPASRPITWNNNIRADITVSISPFTLIFNNTIICGPNSRFGIADQNDSRSTAFFNNLIVGAVEAGIARSNNTGFGSEYNNVIVDSPKLVVNVAGTGITAGTGTVVGTTADFDGSTALYIPKISGKCDGTGATPPSFGLSFSGQLLHTKASIGALHAA